MENVFTWLVVLCLSCVSKRERIEGNEMDLLVTFYIKKDGG